MEDLKKKSLSNKTHFLKYNKPDKMKHFSLQTKKMFFFNETIPLKETRSYNTVKTI